VRTNTFAAERSARLRRSARSILLLCLMAGLPGPASGQNILNNGGFETGLMCYGFWTWSITGVDFAGDYRFTLSTDSHSGDYSLQIACTPGGTDCWRAGVYTALITAIPNQQYTASVWVKCPTGGGGLFFVNSTAGSVGGQWLACNATWTFNSMNLWRRNGAFANQPSSGKPFGEHFGAECAGGRRSLPCFGFL
jgi:hypothetical protein